MTRDDEYLRKILFEMEEDGNPFSMSVLTFSPSEEEAKHWYHVRQLIDYGYATQVGRDSVRLTAQGHDYLNAIRDEGIWQRTKATVAETGGNATLDIMKQIAVAYLKKKIADQTGLDF